MLRQSRFNMKNAMPGSTRAVVLSVLAIMTACTLRMLLYSASYCLWLNAHPQYDDAEWARRFLVCVAAVVLVLVVGIAAFVATVRSPGGLKRAAVSICVLINLVALVVSRLVLR